MNSAGAGLAPKEFGRQVIAAAATRRREGHDGGVGLFKRDDIGYGLMLGRLGHHQDVGRLHGHRRSEEHTSELQSLMRISYPVFCLKKKNKTKRQYTIDNSYNLYQI